MVSLNTVGRRFESVLVTDQGKAFFGTIEPNSEGRLPSYEISEPRLLLRVDHLAPVSSGDIIKDVVGRRFIVADHDISFTAGQVEYRTHRLFHTNRKAVWERETSVIDPLTQQKRSPGSAQLGEIWCLMEAPQREFSDPQLRVREERLRVVLAQPVELGDILDQMVVRRINPILGVYVAEVQ